MSEHTNKYSNICEFNFITLKELRKIVNYSEII